MAVYAAEISEAMLADPDNTFGTIITMVGQDVDVLEIGCATGYVSRFLVEKRSCRVTGVEINPQAAQVARAFCSGLVVGNIEDEATLSQIAGPYDVILLADVLEHLLDPGATLARLRERLCPGGHLVISLPNVAHWSIRRALWRGVWEYTERGILDRTHMRFFTLASALAMLAAAGYRPAERRQTYIFPGHWRVQTGRRLGTFAHRRRMPRWFDELFAYQFIFRAVLI